MSLFSKQNSINNIEYFCLLGRLTVHNVTDYQQQGNELLIASPLGVGFDLSEAEVEGSVVIALLISWQRKALAKGKTLTITNAPENILAMADVSGVRSILPFNENP